MAIILLLQCRARNSALGLLMSIATARSEFGIVVCADELIPNSTLQSAELFLEASYNQHNLALADSLTFHMSRYVSYVFTSNCLTT